MLTPLLVLSPQTSAIIIRHDREDARYLDLARRYPSVGAVTPFGVATLIHPQWVITAAHVAQSITPFSRSVRFGDRDYPIANGVLHPSWKGAPAMESVDLALLLLETPVPDVAPLDLHRDADETGRTITIIGNGKTGDGRSGGKTRDYRWRAATNVVDAVRENWLQFTFDAPPAGTDLEGGCGAGDSGGPAIVEIDARPRLVGVSSAVETQPSIPVHGYGSIGHYVRIAAQHEWIRRTTSTQPPPAPWSKITELKNDNWPTTTVGSHAREWFAALNRADEESLIAFERRARSDAALRAQPAERRAAEWRESLKQWGTARPTRFCESGPATLFVLVYAEKPKGWLSITLTLDPAAPDKLADIAIVNATPP